MPAVTPELEAIVSLRVPYQDADPAGVVWHGNYFRYFDAARCALLERIDYGYRRMAESGFLWPIVDTRVRYVRSLRYDQVIAVEAALLEWEYRLKIAYVIRDEAGVRLTEAYTVQVAVDIETGELCLGAPDALARRLDRLARAG
ncbi:acyl-CoA thioesterase [soil metagenome]